MLARKTSAADLLTPVELAYRWQFRRFGATPQGVYWRNKAGQQARFEALALVFDETDKRGGVTVNDLGCGYGALFAFLDDRPELRGGTYTGYDLCADLVGEAKARNPDSRAAFVHATEATLPADYGFASGTFNLHENADEDAWLAYVQDSLRQLWAMSAKGMAFNMLNRDRAPARGDLFYADPTQFRAFAEQLSPDVRWIDNAPLPDWTIVIRRAGTDQSILTAR